jgi:DnaJ-domain-containing protein 1
MKVWLWLALAIILIVLYAISPLDLIPDVPGVGWVDDLILIGVLIWFLMTRRAGESPGDFYRRYRGYKRPSPGQGESRYEEKRDGEAPRDHEGGDPFKILGVEPGASPDEIKAAYRRAVAKYHPDKVTHLGKEFQEMAHKKLVAIQRAYEALMKR